MELEFGTNCWGHSADRLRSPAETAIRMSESESMVFMSVCFFLNFIEQNRKSFY